MKVLIHEWVTGGGLAGQELPPSWAAEGMAMRRVIAADFQSLNGVEVVTTLDERFAADEAVGELVRVVAGDEDAVLARLAPRCDYTVLIAPETGGVLSDRSARIARVGGRSLGSTTAAIDLTTDKQHLAAHLIARGIKTPRTEPFEEHSAWLRDFPYPAVVKPIDGAGSLDTWYCEGPDDARVATNLPAKLVIQPYCVGEPMSATFLVGPLRSIRLVGVGWQRIEVKDGLFLYRGGRMPASGECIEGDVLDAVRAVEGLRGFVGVDFIRDATTGTSMVIEINPRPTTSYVGLARLLPPGTIARTWLDLFSDRQAGDDLRGMIPADSGRRIKFDPDGQLTEE